MLLLDHDDRVKSVGLRLSAHDPVALTRIARAVAAALKTGDFSPALASIEGSSPPALSAAERVALERRLAHWRSEPSSIVARMSEFDLERAAYLARAPDKREWAFAFHLFALRGRVDIPSEAFEGLVWLLEPRLRGGLVELLQDLPGARELVERAEDSAAVIASSEPLRLLFGTERFEVDGRAVLAPAEHGYAAKLGTNAIMPAASRDVQARLEAAVPRDLVGLLPSWRRTYPFSFKDISTRLTWSNEPARSAYFEKLQRDADWHFVRVMGHVDRALTKIRAFRARARRHAWVVSSTDALDA